MAVNPLDVYRVVADQTMDPAEKRAQIDMLYGVTAPPAIAQAPDLRTADAGMSMGGNPESIMYGSGGLADSSPAPPAPSPAVSDVPAGGMSVAPPVSNAAVSEAPAMSTISPADLAAAAASKQSTPAAPVPAGPTDQQAFDEGIRQLVGTELRGGPRYRIPAHDQPTGSVTEKAAPLPDDIKERLAVDAQAQAGMAIEQGEQAEKAHLDAAIAADNEAHQARTDREDFLVRQKAQEEHLGSLDTGFEQLVKDTENEPGSWWASKNAPGKVLALISAVMFGLAGDANGLQKLIDADIAQREANRKVRLGAAKSKIDSFRAQMLSPEAAHQAERALASQAIAADARRLAEAAASPEARLRGEQLALQFQDQFDKHAEEMARGEAGTIKTQIAHVPTRAGGGPVDPLALLKRLKDAGLNPEQALRALTGGSYGGGALGKDERETAESTLGRTVVFPDGTKLYARQTGEAVSRQKAVDAATEILNSYNALEQMASKPGHSISPTDLARIKTTISRNLLNLKNSEELGAISKTDMDLIDPLSGAGASDTFSLDASTRASIDQARQLLQFKLNTGKGSLFQQPFSNERTGGVKASDVEVPST